MKAIILAGGKGTRLQKVVSDLPKPLAPVKGEPFIHILIRFLKFHGIEEILISTHHLAEKFAERLGDFKKLANVSLAKEPAPLGTGGAVKFVCRNLNPDEYILVLNGDTFFDFDLKKFIGKRRQETALALKNVPDSSRYGTVKLNGDHIASFQEKAQAGGPGTAYAGYSIIQVKDVLALLPEGPTSLETNFFPELLRRKRPIAGDIFDGAFIDIGIPEDYEFANTEFDFSRFSNASH
jgi:D-glycero-alpha-D-manno-heptose 1-phosphate guanylyltransferase